MKQSHRVAVAEPSHSSRNSHPASASHDADIMTRSGEERTRETNKKSAPEQDRHSTIITPPRGEEESIKNDQEQRIRGRRRSEEDSNSTLEDDTISTITSASSDYNSDARSGSSPTRRPWSPVFQSYWDLHFPVRTIRRPAILCYRDTKKTLVEKPSGEFEYRVCPSLNEKQQYISEYLLPIVLPGIFYLLNLSSFGLRWCFTMVIGHTIETILTNFGPSTRHFRAIALISPILHHFIDCLWLHSLISAMLLCPHKFTSASASASDPVVDRRKVTYAAYLLIQTLPIYLVVSFKSNYIKRQHQQQHQHVEYKGHTNVKAGKVDTSKISVMGMHIRRCFVWYWAATIFLMIASSFATVALLRIGVLFLDVIPVGLTAIYLRSIR